ncbi:MAG: ABC-2 transporter permease [Gemmatimonadota bacterium]
MFNAIFYTQWKWSRLLLLVATFAGLAIPLVSIQSINEAYGNFEVVHTIQGYGIGYPLLAACLGLLLSLTAWGSDHRGRHVYALSLPIPRWHYVMLRYISGLLLLLAPILAVWIGGTLATHFIKIPAGLEAYSGSLAVRFALCALLAYTAFFAISAGTPRTAGIVLGIGAGLVAAQVLLSAAGIEVQLLKPIVDGLFIWPGPFEIFTGRWMLLDV